MSLPIGVIAPRPVRTTLRSVFIACSARSHPDALDGLEKFALGLDGRRDDDFGLLEFGNRPRADVAHASGNRADEVLTSIVHLGRTEEDLFQRTSRADFDAGAARQIRVRR